MSEFQVRVVRLGQIRKHPKADTLSITEIGGNGGYPVILRTGEFQEGDLAVYVSIGALVPAADPRWAFLKPAASAESEAVEGFEIEAKRLRGVFSMGILTRAEPGWVEGQDVAAELGITRVDPPEPTAGNERDPGLLPVYTDIVGLRACPGILVDGEEVVITEKIHGETAAYIPFRMFVVHAIVAVTLEAAEVTTFNPARQKVVVEGATTTGQRRHDGAPT